MVIESEKFRDRASNGEDTLTKQVYCPASDTWSGLIVKFSKLPVPDVTFLLWYSHIICVVMFKLPLSVTLAVQVRMKGWPAVKGPFSGVMEASTDSEGTAKRFSVEKQMINICKHRWLLFSHPSQLVHPGTLITSKYEKHQSANLAHVCIRCPLASLWYNIICMLVALNH